MIVFQVPKGSFWKELSCSEAYGALYIDQLCTIKMSLRVTNQTASLKVMSALLT